MHLCMLRRLNKRDGPVMSLRAIRIQDPSDLAPYYVESGDLTRLQFLFGNNEISPHDIDVVTNDCLLLVCTNAQLMNTKLSEHIPSGTRCGPAD